jgi:hypothetical protein
MYQTTTLLRLMDWEIFIHIEDIWGRTRKEAIVCTNSVPIYRN